MTQPGTQRRILLAAYFYPPLKSVGARRPFALAKWLAARGHEVRVITSAHSGDETTDAWPVIRTGDLLATRLNWRSEHGNFEAQMGRSDAPLADQPSIWGRIVVPDVQLLTWAPGAARAARRQMRDGWRPDIVVSTSPVESAHLVGLALSRRGVPWVADLRDGWRFDPPRPEWPLSPQRRIDARMERRVLRRADAVVGVTEQIAADLHTRLGIDATVITNAFDPDDAPDGSLVAAAPVRPDRLTLVHTGSLGGMSRSLRPVLDAVVALGAEERIEILLAGPLTGAEAALFAEPRFAGFIRLLGFLDRPASLALQRAADGLLIVTFCQEAPGKLFEYLAAGRPILVLGDRGAAADIVRAQQAGLAIPKDDPSALRAALTRMLDGGVPQPPPAAALSHLWPELITRYETVIERAISARS
ncbi:unannotated protein [freshwater metagenome]|uniref:Unannotated protein n=1 Tax=freshwater metagenome TaxID=449393 RepID=A0A6J7HKX9_9ZZZZ|nr:glycosyltransferase [Actinomycetota bacterium]